MTNRTLMSHCDVDTYRTWRQSRISPAYVRGLPSWMWQTAMRHERHRHGVRAASSDS